MVNLSKLDPAQHFDFWLGTWDVSWGADEHGVNCITRILDGHVIQEAFDGRPSMAFQGTSLTVYSPKLKIWQQTWADSEGSYWHFTGGLEGEQMILQTDDWVDARPVKLRMRFTNISEDTLDWIWERSDDVGRSWQAKWEIHYARKLNGDSSSAE